MRRGVVAGRSVAGLLALGMVAAAVAIAQAPPAPPRPGTPAAYWLEAQQAVNGDSASVRYARLASRFPRNPSGQAALFELAEYHYARGDYQAARGEFDRVRGPQFRDARYREAVCTFALGDPVRARNLARDLVRRREDPVTWLAAMLMAQTWETEGRLPEALTAYRRLLDLPAGPAQPAALLGAARVAERSKEHKESLEYLNALLKRYPNAPEAAESRDLLESEAPPPGEPGAEKGAKPRAPDGSDSP
jgi:tetratricopeptide (TPR) repeat protein